MAGENIRADRYAVEDDTAFVVEYEAGEADEPSGDVEEPDEDAE
jgi:hypothetical protein